jgi:NAD-dependent SIR2 family protein deacetylase
MSPFREAAQRIADSDALLISAGAGMGVDSGLPDFRGNEGFWRAYPALKGHSFYDMANPRWFDENPRRAWGFYGHRLNLYRQTIPHAGFHVLKSWAESRSHFVFTSNVDGQFQKSGLSEGAILECHGSIHHLQNLEGFGEIWSAKNVVIDVDESRFLASDPLPKDIQTGSICRPNILMFGDYGWNPTRTRKQEQRFENWLKSIATKKLVVIEMGAGTAIPTVRNNSEHHARLHNATLIRINPREAYVNNTHGIQTSISISTGAKKGLLSIQKALEGL